MKTKPDCTGQRFGRLVVLGKGSKRKRPDRNSYRQLWKLQCDCGRVIELSRGDFDYGRQISCGCARRLGLVDNKQRPFDITGQRFGELTAIRLTGNRIDKKPTWLMQCSCGNTIEYSLSKIRNLEYQSLRINCRDHSKHLDRYLTYPPTPTPYPKDAGKLLSKYLHLTELNYIRIDSAVEDEKRDRLIRAAWILTYRRQQGEHISELHEKRIIDKHLRYCSIDVFWKRKLESQGGFLYDVSNTKKQIGFKMTNQTSNNYLELETQEKIVDQTSDNYPAIETQGITMLPTKKLRFKRC